jgi:pimeloyl-ACP methyl ester carboxylesterase
MNVPSSHGLANTTTRLSLTGADRNKLVCDVYGSGEGPTIILLHGGGQSRSSWRIAAQTFGQADFKACSLDLRGHGDSDWAADGNYCIDRFVADLVSVIEALGAPAILMGASFGGHVSLVTAARHPSLVKALVLCDVTPWIEGRETRAMRAMMCTAAAGFASLEDAANHIDKVRGYSSNLDASRLRKHLRQGTDSRLYWRWDPQFFISQDTQNSDFTDLLIVAAENLATPTLLIRAELSKVVTPQQVLKFRQVVPHVRTALVTGALHTVAPDDNDKYASITLEFLSRLPSSGSLQNA